MLEIGLFSSCILSCNIAVYSIEIFLSCTLSSFSENSMPRSSKSLSSFTKIASIGLSDVQDIKLKRVK